MIVYNSNTYHNNDNTNSNSLHGVPPDGKAAKSADPTAANRPAREPRPISLLRLSLPRLRFVDNKKRDAPYGHENSTPQD